MIIRTIGELGLEVSREVPESAKGSGLSLVEGSGPINSLVRRLTPHVSLSGTRNGKFNGRVVSDR